MSAELNIVVHSVLVGASTGSIDITTTDLDGMTPKAVMVICSDNTAFDAQNDGVQLGIGFSDGVRMRATGASAEHNSVAHKGFGVMKATSLLYVPNDTRKIPTWRASIVSFITNGIRLNVQKAASGGRTVTFIFFAGTSVTGQYAGSVTNVAKDVIVDVTDPGFKPDLILLAKSGGGTTEGTWFENGPNVSWGFAYEDSVPVVNQFSLATNCTELSSPTETYNELGNVYPLAAFLDATASTYRVEVLDFDADGFSTRLRVGAPLVNNAVTHYLALKFADDVFVGHAEHITKTSTGLRSKTGVGFQPVFMLNMLNGDTVLNVTRLNNAAPSPCLGVATLMSESAYSMSMEDAVTPSDVSDSMSTGSALEARDENGAVIDLATLSSFDADGFTLDYTTADATARKVLSLLIGTVPPPPPNNVIIGANF